MSSRSCKARPRHNGNGNGNGGSVFNAGTAVNIAAILFSFVAAMGGFYALTNWRLTEHDTAISDEQKARQTDRTEFIDKLGKINDNIGTLNTHAAVQDEQSKEIATTLDRISHQLEGATVKPGR